MGWVRSGSRASRFTRVESGSELRGGFAVERAAEMRLMASLRWFEEHRRGMTSLICLTSSSVRAALLFVEVLLSVVVVQVASFLISEGDEKLRDGFRWKICSFVATDFMAAAGNESNKED